MTRAFEQHSFFDSEEIQERHVVLPERRHRASSARSGWVSTTHRVGHGWLAWSETGFIDLLPLKSMKPDGGCTDGKNMK